MITSRLIPLLLLPLVASLGLKSARWHGQQMPYCRTPGLQSQIAIVDLDAFVSSSQGDAAQFRTTWGIPTLAPGQVTLASDEAKCLRASTMLDSLKGVAPTNEPVYVYQLGTALLVIDDGIQANSEMRRAVLADTAWVFKTYLGVANARP